MPVTMFNIKYKTKTGIKPKHLQAFSLIELTVSMAIIGIIMAMLSNVLVNSIIISQKSIARSFIREEISNITDQILNDVRDSTNVGQCDGVNETAKCVVSTDVGIVTWQTCADPTTAKLRVCKIDAQGANLFTSSSNLELTQLSFSTGFDDSSNAVKKNVIITVIGGHVNQAFNVHNVLRQESVSTRNYILQSMDNTLPLGLIRLNSI